MQKKRMTMFSSIATALMSFSVFYVLTMEKTLRLQVFGVGYNAVQMVMNETNDHGDIQCLVEMTEWQFNTIIGNFPQAKFKEQFDRYHENTKTRQENSRAR